PGADLVLVSFDALEALLQQADAGDLALAEGTRGGGDRPAHACICTLSSGDRLHERFSHMLHVAILGGSGYTALDLLKILHRHPHARVVAVTSRQEGTPKLADVHPALAGRIDLAMEPFDVDRLLARGVQCAFGCLPHGASMAQLPRLLERGVRVIDLSADY